MKEGMVNIKLSDVRPNPNRDLKFNPYNEEKITTLMASINSTGYWTNTIVRPAPDGKGYELAYGHHRLESAKRCGIKEAEFVVRDLDENMLLKMMENENQEEYRYCPLSLLESVKAVINALAAGRIAPFAHKDTTGRENVGASATLRYAPSCIPQGTSTRPPKEGALPYTVVDIAKYLGLERKQGAGIGPNSKVVAALDALYLLEVKAISTASIKDMNWAQLGKFVADMKANREREILRTKKTAEEVRKINEQSLKLQAEQRAKEKQLEEERKELVKKLAEAKREEDAKKAKELQARIEVKEEQAEKVAEVYTEKKAALKVKVEEAKKQEIEAKKEDTYVPIRKEADRIVHILERRSEEEEIKALARKPLNPSDRERLRQAAITRGTWYTEWVAQQFLPPLSAKSHIEDYRKREAAKQRAEEAKEKNAK